MYQHIKTLCENLLFTKIFSPLGLEPISLPLERPKQKNLGHFATPIAFLLAKPLRKAPNIIASELSEIFSLCEEFSKVQALNGYINLTLSEKFLDSLCEKALDNDYFISHTPKAESILLEFVSANPTGPLHIGHARGAIYGDSLKRIGEFLGYKIVSEYYINDAGAQIEVLGLSVFLAGNELLGREVSYPEQYYKGLYIVDIAKLALEKFGASIFENKESIARLSEFAKDLMLEEIKENLQELNISFDNFVSEKALFSRWDSTLRKLVQNGGVEVREGKTWLLSSQKGDEKDRVIVRESGEPTYLAGDIIYHNDKFERNFSRYINIWGADHHGYIPRVKAAIEFLGYDSARLEVLLSQMVALSKNGQNYKMSKRAGNFILLKDVVADIGAEALRFVFLTKRVDTHLEFDVDTLSAQDSNNPIFYINYANARIHTLIEKSGLGIQEISNAKGAYESLEENLKEDLLFLQFHALGIHQVLESAFKEREIQKLCEYLKNLASDLHSFYNTHTILQHQQSAFILKTLLVVSKSITLGLGLIGIRAKTKM
ncbi:arginine--tRNA ligase [Helicobacter himalayensis]|uniref:arginine--tRNA ligase n=1 Tax=Helicobacter himalayensis TaxID=1591088 RepID=UPI00082A8865|nr:arginine--tRNA ligase [Helicobacter himalayensis]